MKWLHHLLRSNLLLTILLNGLLLTGFTILRLMQPTTALRPSLSLSPTPQLSLANWVADRLADIGSLVETLLQQLL